MKLNKFFNGFKNGIKNFGENISIIVNTILLTMVYIIGVGITSLIAKMFKKHFLDKNSKDKSYWKVLDLKKKKIEEYYRQF